MTEINGASSKTQCLLFKMRPTLEDDELSAMAEAVPFAKNCIDCKKRLAGRLEAECSRGAS